MTKWLPLAALLAACDNKQDTTAAADDWVVPGGGEITVETRDGVVLVADYYPAEAEGAPALLLLHMNPSGGFQRSDWPAELISPFVEAGWAVLNLDRRGSGDSEGVAREAHTGENGRYDVEAAMLRLEADGYGSVFILGASNGTTSMIDYAALAAEEDGLPAPVAMGFLTGGAYTETNTAFSAVPAYPSIFVYADDEAQWSNQYNNDQPELWSFHEIPAAGHGTQMFLGDASETVVDLLTAFAQGL